MKKLIPLLLILAIPSWSQVIDGDGDGTVEPHEAIAVSKLWKGPASAAANAHDHLEQIWTGPAEPLEIRGDFFIQGEGQRRLKRLP